MLIKNGSEENFSWDNDECCFCGQSMEKRITLNYISDEGAFPFMEIGKRSHIECYIKEICEQTIMEVFNLKRKEKSDET